MTAGVAVTETARASLDPLLVTVIVYFTVADGLYVSKSEVLTTARSARATTVVLTVAVFGGVGSVAEVVDRRRVRR